MPSEPTMGPGRKPGPLFTEIEHTADYALRIHGRDYSDLLENAARGLYTLIGPKDANKAAAEPSERRVVLEAEDEEGLLVEWLSELAYWVESDMFVGSDISIVDVSGSRLEASVRGRAAGGVDRLIKAVTYHDLEIEKTPYGLTATVVFDV